MHIHPQKCSWHFSMRPINTKIFSVLFFAFAVGVKFFFALTFNSELLFMCLQFTIQNIASWCQLYRGKVVFCWEIFVLTMILIISIPPHPTNHRRVLLKLKWNFLFIKTKQKIERTIISILVQYLRN